MSRRTSRALFAIAAVALVVRVAVWWFKGGIHYPDEIFQQVEPAHFLRTGVAMLPWEFGRGVRSWVLPGVYAGNLELLSWLGIDGLPAFRFLRLQNACLSIVMVPAGYRIGVALWSREDREDAERAGLAVAAFTALLPVLAYYTPHTLIGTVSNVALCWGYAHWLEARQADSIESRGLLLCGLFFGIAGAVRFTSGFHMLVPLVDLVFRFRFRAIRSLLVGASVPVLIVGVVDYFTWGQWFHSLVEHLRFNYFEDGASRFGTSPWSYYLTDTLWSRLGPLAPLTYLVAAAGLRRSWPLLLTMLVPTILLSTVEHKEDRFLMYNWPLLSGMLGVGICVLASWLKPRFAKATWPALALLAVALLLSNLKGTAELPWKWRTGIFEAQHYVSQQPDATGLMYHGPLFWNGGYLIFQQVLPQVTHARRREKNPVFNYAALVGGRVKVQRLRSEGWTVVARFGPTSVLRRPPMSD